MRVLSLRPYQASLEPHVGLSNIERNRWFGVGGALVGAVAGYMMRDILFPPQFVGQRGGGVLSTVSGAVVGAFVGGITSSKLM
jgi:hypothetical protein